MIEPAPGRPKDKQKHEDMLAAAKSIMLEIGVEGAAIEQIAAHAGVSKATIYRNFKDKQGLFIAVVERETRRLAEIGVTTQENDTLRDKLIALSLAFTDLALSPSHLALEAVISQEKSRHPDLSPRFFAAGPKHFRDLVAGMLRADHLLVAAKDMSYVDAAGHLIALMLGFEAVTLRFNDQDHSSKQMRRVRIEQAIDLFLGSFDPR
jgi:TetR/AcrR family transcriptional repressor of mexJK operon